MSIPLRRFLSKSAFQFSPFHARLAGGCFGFINGGMSGSGILLISILMSVGLSGEVLIATDAVISLIMGVTKVVLFGGLSALTLELALVGLLVGFCTAPGAFVARWLLKHLSAGVHAWIMEVVVVIGALSLLKHLIG